MPRMTVNCLEESRLVALQRCEDCLTASEIYWAYVRILGPDRANFILDTAQRKEKVVVVNIEKN